jgi:membrane protease YdiL (CAAX protease family)
MKSSRRATMLHVITAVMTGILVLLAGNLPWAGFGRMNGLAAWNFRIWTAVPWALVPMGLYLWAYWRFIGGSQSQSAGAAARRLHLRANSLPRRVWVASLGAGALGFATLLVLLSVAARLVRLPASAPIITPPQMPVLTGFLLLAMQSIVAGVTEEAAFRGYMQSMIERRYGVAAAILVNGVVFGLLHFSNHPADVLTLLPYYVAVSAVYGGLTWAADSILPALVLHSVGDVVVLTRWWLTGLPEWQVSAASPPLVWGGGIDTSLVATTFAGVALVAVTGWAYTIIHNARVGSLVKIVNPA